jgi:hypothetical protein
MATSGWIASVSATQNCLPGEVCYGVKMAAEKTQEIVVTVAGSNQAATQMHLEHAGRRAEEIKKVAENNASDAPKQAEVAIKSLEKSIQSAQETLKNVGENEPEKMVEATKEMATKTEEIKTNLQEAQKQNIDVNVTEAKKIVADIKVEAIVNVIEKQAEGKLPGATEEVKSLVTDHINNLLADSKDVQTQVVDVVKGVVIVPTSTTENTITSTLPAILTTSTISSEVKAVVVEASKAVTETGKTVEKSLGEAQVFVNNNQLKEAIEKVKEATDVTQKSEQAVVDAAKVVKEITTSNTTTSINIVLPLVPTTTVPVGTTTLEKK